MATETAVVDVKSAWASKINWTQAVAVIASVLVLFGIDVPPEAQAQIVVAITSVSGIVTWVLKTWFTTSVTPSSAAKAA